MVTPEEKHHTVRYFHESFRQSPGKLCILPGLSRASCVYNTMPNANEPIGMPLREPADERKRGVLYQLRLVGIQIRHERTELLYREGNLILRIKWRNKMAADIRVSPPIPERRYQCWAMRYNIIDDL